MRPHHEPAEEPIVEVEPSQLWLRQRRLQVRSRSASAGDAACTREAAANRSLPVSCRTIDSADLLAGRREVQIVHAGETYRLLVTRNNKLILQK